MLSRTPTIAAACIAVAMLMLDISVINTALSDMAAGLSTDLGGLQWVVDAYTLPLAALVLTAGVLADRLGRRRLFLWGLAAFTVTSAICGAAGTIDALVAARALQGVGAALLFATALALIAAVTPEPADRAKGMAAFGVTVGVAFAIGPFVGGVLTEAFGWRAIFLVNVPIGIAALALTLRFVPESRDPEARRIDWPGQLTLIGGLFALVYGLLHGNEDGWGSAPIVAALAGGVALLVAWGAVQARSRAPMIPLALLRQPRFAGAQVAAFAMAASFYSLFLYITLYLQTVLGRSPIETGLAYLPGTVVMFFVAGAAAQLMQRISAVRLTVAGLLLTAGGMAAMVMADAGSSWTALLPGILLSCVGMGLFNPAASELGLRALPDHQSGLAAGANDTFRQTGVAVGIAALGTLVPELGGSPQAYVDGFHTAALVAAGIATAGALGTAWLLREKLAVDPGEIGGRVVRVEPAGVR